MIAALLSPLGRLAAMAALVAAVGAWGALERAGRVSAGLRLQAAQHALAQAEERIRNMETRHEADDRAARDADPVGSLQRGWSRDQ